MPSRKKTKLSPPAGSTPTDNPQSNGITPNSGANPESLIADPWSEEQETSLLKGVIRWKPVGMHKHFRMIAISDHMKSQGYAQPHLVHTRIPGIWKKLGSMYNLAGLDEREDPIMAETDEQDDGNEFYCPFKLPESEYGEMMWERRLDLDGSSSPPISPVGANSIRGSTVADTDEPRSPPATGSRNRRNRVRGGNRSGRGFRLPPEIETKNKSKDKPSPANMEDIVDDSEEGEGDESSEHDNGVKPIKSQSNRGKGKRTRGTAKRASRRR